MPSLRRDSDGVGDVGAMSMAIWTEKDGKRKHEHSARPRLGVQLRVGSITARTYVEQDYWQTTDILEILSDDGETVRFRTKNSIYTWRA